MDPKMDKAIHYAANRLSLQLRMLIGGYLSNQGITYSVDVYEGSYNGYRDEYGWLSPGYIFRTGKGNFIVSGRSVWGNLVGHYPRDTLRYMTEDVGLQGVLSKHNDIIAYEAGTPSEIINKVLEICNSAQL